MKVKKEEKLMKIIKSKRAEISFDPLYLLTH
jgi:hypothetical protein